MRGYRYAAPVFRIIGLSVLFAAVLAIAGCGARRPVATSVPSAPAPAPVSTPAAPASPSPSAPSVAIPPPASAASPFVPGVYVEQGIASWYGKPFDGRRAADGEVYNMNAMVAAHRTLPFGSVVRVTNLNNGLTADVRIIDRGPFVDGRILDLSRAAAKALRIIGPGTAPVRIQLLYSPMLPGGDFAVQVGAFSVRSNAARLRDRLLAHYQPVTIREFDTANGPYYRVLVGRFASLESAQDLADELHANNGYQTFVVRIDTLPDVSAK